MTPHDTITEFYTAFAALDTHRMAACYSENATFEDEAFNLRGKTEIMGMWNMLCDGAKAMAPGDWKFSFSDVQASGSGANATGLAHWEPIYRFSLTKRMVHNVIDASFTFDAQGKILTHRDRFDFWRWSRMALGTPGALLGWSPFLRNKVRQQANSNLRKYIAKANA
jgi:SnoaL-like domain